MKIEGLGEKRKVVDSMNKNFLLISLEEKQTKKIAEVINNDTSRKILDHLANKECTETELSKELGIAISTIHYNLKQLIDANLVIVEEFHYSAKGKEVNHYKLANKYIIIAPKNQDNRVKDALQKIWPLGAIIVVTAGAALFLKGLGNASKVASNEGMLLTAKMAPEAANVAYTTSVARDAVNTTVNTCQPVVQPLINSNTVIAFSIGAISVLTIILIYNLLKKKK